MSASLPEIASRIFDPARLCVDAGKAAAIVTALGPRIFGEPKVVVVGAKAIEHKAFQNGRPSAGRLGDRTGRELDRRRLQAFERIGPVAVIPIEGSLVAKGAYVGASSGRTSYEGLTAQIVRAGKDSSIKGVVFEVDSFGGEVAGMFDAAALISKLSSEKPTISILTDHALSAAYALASAARQIVIPEHGSAGSIGAVALHADMTGALEKDGVRVTVLRAGARKAEANPYEALSADAAGSILRDLERIRESFANMVARLRVTPTVAERVRDGDKPLAAAYEEAKVIEAERAEFNRKLDRLKASAREQAAGGARLARIATCALSSLSDFLEDCPMADDQPKKSKRGFASMDPEKRRKIASMGGKSVPAELRSFSKNTDLASKAGQKGGRAVAPENRTFSRDPALAAEAGVKGGKASHGSKKKGEEKD